MGRRLRGRSREERERRKGHKEPETSAAAVLGSRPHGTETHGATCPVRTVSAE